MDEVWHVPNFVAFIGMGRILQEKSAEGSCAIFCGKERTRESRCLKTSNLVLPRSRCGLLKEIEMKALIGFFGVFLLAATTSAHPSGSASVLEHNIAAIKLKVPVNIPPNAQFGLIVQEGHSVCLLFAQKAESFDRSVTPKVERNGKVIPVTLPLLTKARNLLHDNIGERNPSVANGAPYVIQDEYAAFDLASEQDPTQPNPNLKAIVCGFSKNGPEFKWKTITDRMFYQDKVVPSMDQLNDFAGRALEFVPGKTVEISGQ
jgi:hypothetical protein